MSHNTRSKGQAPATATPEKGKRKAKAGLTKKDFRGKPEPLSTQSWTGLGEPPTMSEDAAVLAGLDEEITSSEDDGRAYSSTKRTRVSTSGNSSLTENVAVEDDDFYQTYSDDEKHGNVLKKMKHATNDSSNASPLRSASPPSPEPHQSREPFDRVIQFLQGALRPECLKTVKQAINTTAMSSRRWENLYRALRGLFPENFEARMSWSLFETDLENVFAATFLRWVMSYWDYVEKTIRVPKEITMSISPHRWLLCWLDCVSCPNTPDLPASSRATMAGLGRESTTSVPGKASTPGSPQAVPGPANIQDTLPVIAPEQESLQSILSSEGKSETDTSEQSSRGFLYHGAPRRAVIAISTDGLSREVCWPGGDLSASRAIYATSSMRYAVAWAMYKELPYTEKSQEEIWDQGLSYAQLPNPIYVLVIDQSRSPEQLTELHLPDLMAMSTRQHMWMSGNCNTVYSTQTTAAYDRGRTLPPEPYSSRPAQGVPWNGDSVDRVAGPIKLVDVLALGRKSIFEQLSFKLEDVRQIAFCTTHAETAVNSMLLKWLEIDLGS